MAESGGELGRRSRTFSRREVMMTMSQQKVLDYVTDHPAALTTEIVAALYPTDPNGDLIVSVCLAALERRGLIGVQPEARAVALRETTGVTVLRNWQGRSGK